jgi:hypothetical protein
MGGVGGRLVGFFPARIARRRYGLGPSVLVGWTHAYAPLGTPLIDREFGAAAVSAWFDHLAHDPSLPRLLLLPYCPEQGAMADALDRAIGACGGKAESFARHRRALLAPADNGRTDYLDRAMGAKKRKELRRQRKRLGDEGAVVRGAAREPAAIAQALSDFLSVEAGGWKGRAGTAASAERNVRDFMATAMAALAAEGKASIESLSVGSQPIASTIVLRSGGTAWCWKIAFDERFAKASPGVQLVADITQTLLDDPTFARADSCATADHPMIDHIWRERLPLADRLIAVRVDAVASFAPARVLERLRRAAIDAAKAASNALRRG